MGILGQIFYDFSCAFVVLHDISAIIYTVSMIRGTGTVREALR